MKLTYKSLIFITIIGIIQSFVSAQQVNTIYFMDNIPFRHNLNPAFQPTTYYYLSLPVVGLTQINVGNNSLTLKDVIYNYNGQTISFLHPVGGNIQRFYNTLRPTTVIHADLETNLLSLGFRYKSAFWSFSLTEKIIGIVDIPKDFFLISLFGTREINNNSFNFTMLQSDVTAYTEAALGYSKKIDDKWSTGIKLKYLLGSANVSNTNKELTMNAGVEKWILKGEGVVNVSSPYQVIIGNNFQSISHTYPTSLSNLIKPSGLGVGIDLGFTYNPIKSLTFSAAIIDLGYIRWKTNAQNINYKIDYSFNGIGQIDSIKNLNSVQTIFDRITTGNSLVDSLIMAVQTASKVSKTYNSYTTFTPTKLNLGTEYSILDQHLSFGLLSRTIFNKKTISEEITASVNAKPTYWLNATLSYSIFGGQFSSVGAGLGLRTGFVHWFVAADYMAFQKATLALRELSTSYWDIKMPIPYNTKSCNFSVGMNLVLDQIKSSIGLHKRKTKQDCNCNIK